MFYAKSASFQSGDLSRQVGAAIVRGNLDILSTGCNEVPAPGGGPYWPGDDDRRDYVEGYDSNVLHKNKMIKQVLRRLEDKGLLNEKITEPDLRDGLIPILSEKEKELFKDIQLFDLLEFGRPVHAEMMAITHAARVGRNIEGASLYCTTFPCHNCARHIVSSGISEVVYIEPYPKSKVKELYGDSIAVEEPQLIPGKVNFTPFVGVAPNRFQELFQFGKGERKQGSGRAKDWSVEGAQPSVNRIVHTYFRVEKRLVATTSTYLRAAGFDLNGR
jgi:cytidine deaminase